MNEWVRTFGKARNSCVLLDYDGTLVGLKKKPELAVLSGPRRGVLKALADRMVLGVVSGRSIGDVRRLVRIPMMAYIGNHGLEIHYRGRDWVHPKAEACRRPLGRALGRIGAATRDLPGVLIENKGLTAGVHFRLLDAGLRRRLREIVREEIRSSGGVLKTTFGKKVIEIRPNVEWDKGRGILEFLRWISPENREKVMYIGDDATDEDAFRALGKDGWTVAVRRTKSAARFHARGIAEVWAFLRLLRAEESDD